MFYMRKFIYFLVIVVLLSTFSCSYFQPSIMFKTPRGYNFTQWVDSVQREYVLRENDVFTMNLYSNDGFRLIDMINTSGGAAQQMLGANAIDYRIGLDKKVKLPVLGMVDITGLTIREAEKFLEKRYSEFYNNPYILIKITNKRVIIFPGSEGTARVVPLQNQNTTLVEALALAGGISEVGKAKKVKLIRGDLSNPTIYLFDLSKIDGIKDASLTLQANDIIYVEPVFRSSKEFLQELSPIMSLVATSLTLIVTIKVLTK